MKAWARRRATHVDEELKDVQEDEDDVARRERDQFAVGDDAEDVPNDAESLHDA